MVCSYKNLLTWTYLATVMLIGVWIRMTEGQLWLSYVLRIYSYFMVLK